jgi:hypothetical protein
LGHLVFRAIHSSTHSSQKVWPHSLKEVASLSTSQQMAQVKVHAASGHWGEEDVGGVAHRK